MKTQIPIKINKLVVNQNPSLVKGCTTTFICVPTLWVKRCAIGVSIVPILQCL